MIAHMLTQIGKSLKTMWISSNCWNFESRKFTGIGEFFLRFDPKTFLKDSYDSAPVFFVVLVLVVVIVLVVVLVLVIVVVIVLVVVLVFVVVVVFNGQKIFFEQLPTWCNSSWAFRFDVRSNGGSWSKRVICLPWKGWLHCRFGGRESRNQEVHIFGASYKWAYDILWLHLSGWNKPSYPFIRPSIGVINKDSI